MNRYRNISLLIKIIIIKIDKSNYDDFNILSITELRSLGKDQ